MITAKVVADSVQKRWDYAPRLTTFVLSYPRWVHAELMTHRVFSRNASSSRAIPIAKMIERATKQTAIPVHWGKNQKGMQADEELPPELQEQALAIWKEAAQSAANYAQKLADLGIHKQIGNRLIENFQNIETVVTSTSWANFYALRNHPDAQPEIKALATAMLEAHETSTPKTLEEGQWHLPFVDEGERDSLEASVAHLSDTDSLHLPAKVSAARCARVSYLNHEGKKPTLEEDLTLYQRLMGGNPKHASPTEHQAMAPADWLVDIEPDSFGNLSMYWIQFRKLVQGEFIKEYVHNGHVYR